MYIEGKKLKYVKNKNNIYLYTVLKYRINNYDIMIF